MPATLTGPVVFPGQEPWVGAQVKVELIAGGSRTPGHVNGSAVMGTTVVETDADGDFSLEVPTLTDAQYPPAAYYRVTFGGNGAFPKYQTKIKPLLEQSYVVTDPAIGGETEDLLPPGFVQIVPEFDQAQVNVAVAAYLLENPIDVSAAVDAALAANPPLLVANNGSDITNDATFLTNVGAAPVSVVTALATETGRIDAIELEENTSPSVRSSTAGLRLEVVDGELFVEVP